MKNVKLPAIKETFYCLATLLLWFTITVIFLGFKPERIGLAILVMCLFFTTITTRKLLVALIPFILFGISYDWMNLLPNYMVNPVDTGGIYNFEKNLFGITNEIGEIVTPNEFFASWSVPALDFLSGIFYLCWVPVPIAFGLYLYFKGCNENYLHFALVFLFVNLLGFTLYYIHPSAPPWYIDIYGFEPLTGTPGNVAGLGEFDRMTGLGIFDALYSRNSNVFAALPSLHSAYPLIAFIYSLNRNSSLAWKIVLGIVTLGIWFGAVYSSHHYIVDVIAGISVTLLGIIIFEWGFMRFKGFKKFMNAYSNYISLRSR